MRRAHESRWVKGAAQGSLEWTGGRMVLYPCILRTRPRTGLVSGTPVLMHLKRHLNVPTHRHRTRPFQGGLTGRISRRFKHATNQTHPIGHGKGGTVPAPSLWRATPGAKGSGRLNLAPVCAGACYLSALPRATWGHDSSSSRGQKSLPLPHIPPQACGWGAGPVPLCVPGSVGMGTQSRRRADH